jgi:hypothetical protein
MVCLGNICINTLHKGAKDDDDDDDNNNAAILADKNVTQKRSRKEATIGDLTYRDTTNVEHEMYDYTGNHWGHRNSNKSLKKSLEDV